MRKMYLSVFLAVSVFVLCSPWYCIGVDINGCAACRETFVCIFNCIHIHNRICICISILYIVLGWACIGWILMVGRLVARHLFVFLLVFAL